MLQYFIGFLWGCFISTIGFDIFLSVVPIAWWIYLIVFIILMIVSVMVKAYLFMTDYKELAETGYSASKKVYSFFKNRKKS